MKQWIRKISRISIAFVLLFVLATPKTYAEDYTSVDERAEDFKTLFQVILDNYNGSEITEEELWEAAIKGMFDALDDYSDFYEVKEYDSLIEGISGEYVGIGIEMGVSGEWVEVLRTFKDSPALKAGVKAGDIIFEVNGESAKGLSPGELAVRIKGEEGTTVSITFKRGDQKYTVDIVRQAIKLSAVEQIDMKELFPDLDEELAKEIRYIQVQSINANVTSDLAPLLFTAKAEGVDQLILDMRGNPGGYVNEAINICKMLIKEGPIFHSVKKDGTKTTHYSSLEKAPFDIVLLIDNDSASATEIIAGAIQDSGAGVIVGEQSYGKGVIQYLYNFGSDYGFKLTMEEFLTRDENKIHGIGIAPDYEVFIPDLIVSDVRLYENDNHEKVAVLESILQYLGYKVDQPDNLFDAKTKEALIKFQEDAGLYGYGTCDFSTMTALNEKLIESVSEDDPQLNKALDIILERLEK